MEHRKHQLLIFIIQQKHRKKEPFTVKNVKAPLS